MAARAAGVGGFVERDAKVGVAASEAFPAGVSRVGGQPQGRAGAAELFERGLDAPEQGGDGGGGRGVGGVAGDADRGLDEFAAGLVERILGKHALQSWRRPRAPPWGRDCISAVKLVGIMGRRLASLPLLWKVFAVNAVVLVLAFAALVFAPITVSVPVAAGELVALVAGLLALLAANLAMLRPAFAPLDHLAETMRRHDPLAPGARAEVSGDPSVAALAVTFNEMLARLEEERRESGRQALLVQEAERRRIARELHDEVGQTLTGVILQGEGLAAQIPDELREQLDELRETVRHGAEEVRTIARRLRPDVLDELGLRSALAALASGFEIRVRVDRHLEQGIEVSPEEELVIYRVAQEALTNVARHADAAQVRLELRAEPGRVVLEVRDDGRGLPAHALGSSHGIRGMRESAMLVGGNLVIDSRPGAGTVVRLVLPR
jgi:two-component system sensor histidine kinase UhpB